MPAWPLPLATERLRLRNFTDGDLASVHAYASDLEVVRYVVWGPNTEADTRNFITHAKQRALDEQRKEFEMALVLLNNSAVIGAASIHLVNDKEAWIGYCLNRKYWGQGYATEAARALLDFGFDHLQLHRIYATVDPRNNSPSQILKKIGMVQEAHFRQNKLAKGAWRDTDVYAILENYSPVNG